MDTKKSKLIESLSSAVAVLESFDNEPMSRGDLKKYRDTLKEAKDVLAECREPRDDQEAAFLSLAKEEWEEEGRCEIDDDAVVSVSEDTGAVIAGAYVQAWVWVDNPEKE